MSARITVILLNWQRPDNIYHILDSLRQIEIVGEVIVWKNNKNVQFTHPWAKVVNTNHDLGLYTRFAAGCLAAHDCLLIQDDDLELPATSLHRLFQLWQADPDIIHGVFGRAPLDDCGYAQYLNGDNDAPVVLTRMLMVHRQYVPAFFQLAAMFVAIQRDSFPFGNGEDILLSYAVRRQSGRLNRLHSLPVNELPAPHAMHQRDWSSHIEHRSRLLRACESWFSSEKGQDQ